MSAMPATATLKFRLGDHYDEMEADCPAAVLNGRRIGGFCLDLKDNVPGALEVSFRNDALIIRVEPGTSLLSMVANRVVNYLNRELPIIVQGNFAELPVSPTSRKPNPARRPQNGATCRT